jgi:signal transduction histidine kinase
VTILCTILLLAWAVGDFEYFPEHAMLFTYFRVAAVVWCVVMAVLAAKLTTPVAKFSSMWLWFLAWGAESAAMIPYTPEHLLSHTFVMVIAQLGSLGFMIWSWTWGLTMSLALLAIGELGLWSATFQGYDTFAAHGYLVTGVALCVLFTAVKHRGAREQFDQRLKLQEEKRRSERLFAEVSEMRQERLTWLESLAHFLRHELRNQVVAIGTSLDLTQGTRLDPDAERYLDRARRSLGRMRRLVQSATEATSVEGAVGLERSDLVNLSEVATERVALLRDTAPELVISTEIAHGVVVEGHEDRIGQLLDKLLENAVEHSATPGAIRVCVGRDDEHVLVAVENDGDRLPADRDALFDAFVSVGGNGEKSENLGLGLFIAKAIAEAHGGTIEALDLDGFPGARFEVRLPIEVT